MCPDHVGSATPSERQGAPSHGQGRVVRNRGCRIQRVARGVGQNGAGIDLQLERPDVCRCDPHAKHPGRGLRDRTDGDHRAARITEVRGIHRARVHVLAEGHRVGHRGVPSGRPAALVIDDGAAGQRRRGAIG